MTRRTRVYASIAAVAAAAISVATIARSSAPPPGHASVAVDLPPAGITAHRAPSRDEPAARTAHAKVDLARVETALARLERSTANVTREQLMAEQRKVAEAAARFAAVKIAEPRTRKFVDSHGTRWIELQHVSGETRYALDPDEGAAPGADSE